MTDDRPDTDRLKPVGHVMLSFASAEQATATRRALGDGAARGHTMQWLDSAEMQARLVDALKAAGPLASLGREVDLARAQRQLAERGYHFLLVHVDDEEQARRVADIASRHGAERALHYGHLVIDELIEVNDTPVQRGVDNPQPDETRHAMPQGRRG
jgi:hypothetical protein